MVSDSGYNSIAKQVYNVEPKKAKSNNEPVVVNKSPIYDDVTKKQYQVLQVSDDPDGNGMQAMAVAPIKGYDAADIKDLRTDTCVIL